ncbi:MAG: response regulator [Planctomycetaceae bacterium]
MVGLQKPYHLLIADDDPGFRETLGLIFEPHFYMIEAASGEEAIELCREQRFDIALLDMHMQRLTGLETLRILKTHNAIAPCILITADATDELRRYATEQAEAYSVLAKPISRNDLVLTVSSALEEVYEDPDAFAVRGPAQ